VFYRHGLSFLAQETYGKLLEATVISVHRSTDSNYWTRRSNKDGLVSNGRDSPMPRGESCIFSVGSMFMVVVVPSELQLDEKPISRPTSPLSGVGRAEQACVSPLVKPTLSSFSQTSHIVQYIGDTALPRLRKFLVDNDRVLTVCTNIMYYIVSPALKTKSRYFTLYHCNLVIELT
jgi:protein dopey